MYPPLPQRSSVADRIPAPVQVLISAGIWLVCFVVPYGLAAADVYVAIGRYETMNWLVVGGQLLFVVALACWGLTTGRRVGAAVLAVVFFGISWLGLGLLMPAIFESFSNDFSYDVVSGIYQTFIAIEMLGWIVPWAIARRRSGLAWVGLIPMLVFLGVQAWYLWHDHGLDEFVGSILAVVIVSVLIFWGLDAIGMAGKPKGGMPVQHYGMYQQPNMYPSAPGYPQQYPAPAYPPRQYGAQPYPAPEDPNRFLPRQG